MGRASKARGLQRWLIKSWITVSAGAGRLWSCMIPPGFSIRVCEVFNHKSDAATLPTIPPSASDSGLRRLGRPGGIDRKRAGAKCGENQQAAHDRDVFLEVEHVVRTSRSIHGPKIVEEKRDGNHVQENDPGSEPRVETHKNRETAQKRYEHRDAQRDRRQRQIFLLHGSFHPRESLNLADSGDDEHGAKQNTPE